MGVPFILKPRRGEIGDPAHLKRFNELFLPALLSQQCVAITDDGMFNLGTEIRHDLGETGAPAPEPSLERGSLSLLKGMLSELNNSAQGGGIILLVLRYASEFMSRAVIFMVRKDEIAGLGQFGIQDADRSADALVRSLRISRDGDTFFRRVIDQPFPQRIRADEDSGSRTLCERLGGGVPSEMFLGPLTSEGKVVAILYGDNLNSGGAIGDTEGLEIFLDQVGLAMEKALLQRRLREQTEVRV